MFKIALTLLLASAADPYVPTPVSIRAGASEAGPGGLDLPAVRGGSSGVGSEEDGTALGRPVWLVQGQGATRSSPATGTHARLGKAGSARYPPLCAYSELESFLSCLPPLADCALLRRPRTPTTTLGTQISLGVGLRLVPGRGEKAFLLPEKPVCDGWFLSKCFAPSHRQPQCFQQCQPVWVLNLKQNYT